MRFPAVIDPRARPVMRGGRRNRRARPPVGLPQRRRGAISDERPRPPRGDGATRLGTGLALGLGLGAAIGLAMGDVAMGIGVGLALGIALGWAIDDLRRRKDRD